MTTSTEEEKLNLDAFNESINKASNSEIDTLWAILKYRDTNKISEKISIKSINKVI